MLKRIAFFLTICLISTSIHAFEDNEARRAILDLRQQIKESDLKLVSILNNINAKLDAIESENKKLKAENEKISADLDLRRPARDDTEYQELRDEINSINRLLLQIMGK
jgi:regulator of replication initiation timing